MVHGYLKKKYSYWSSRGIAGPRSLPFLGNILPMFMRRSMDEVEMELARKYGKVCGLYYGTKPA